MKQNSEATFENFLKNVEAWLEETEEAATMIKDSGERQQFETGAVRDITEGKGRCDLLPLGVLARFYPGATGRILKRIDKYIREGDLGELKEATKDFIGDQYPDQETAFLDVAIHYEQGAKKYAERNWEKGIPQSNYINSAVRHLLKRERRDIDEPHDRAFIWNLLGAMWTQENKPELVDLPWTQEGSDNNVGTIREKEPESAGIRELSRKEANALFNSQTKPWVSKYKPEGSFFVREGEVIIGIDNQHGEAWTEEFTNLKACKIWLKGDMTPEKAERLAKEAGAKKEKIRPGIYRHFKGDRYRVKGTGTCSETDKELVIYTRIRDGKEYARPLGMFIEKIDRAKYPAYTGKQDRRFQWIGPEEEEK